MAKRSMRLFAKMDVEALRVDPRFVAVGAAGFVVFWRGVAYSKEVLSDGFVAKGSLPFVTVGLRESEAKAAVKALLDCGLWIPAEGGYSTPEGWWQENQVTAEQVEAKRDADAERKRKERERRQAEKDRLKAAQDAPKPLVTHEVVTRDGDRDSQRNHDGVTGLSREGTEHRAQSTEMPSGIAAAASVTVPLLGGWQPLGDWLDDPDLRRGLSRIEGNRSPGVAPVRADQVGVLAEVLRTNHVGLRDLVGVLDDPETRGWRKLDPEGVLRVWRRRLEEAQGTCNPGGNSGVEGFTSEAELSRIEGVVRR